MTDMNPPLTQRPRSLWPHAIIAWFVAFASALAAWVTVVFQQDMDLVRPDYYEEEIRFQRQLDQMNRTAAIRHDVSVLYDPAEDEVTVRLPAGHAAQHPVGSIQFYRPSNAALDFDVPLAVETTGVQNIDASALRSGHWRIRVRWTVAAREYFFEQQLVLVGAGTSSAATAPKGM
ncbi:MAG TPA: FixH family protein [Methylomirabilota bacterium]|nr:FixH family protein [Methylomirabilota bacterium]